MLSLEYVAGFFDGEGCVFLTHNSGLQLRVIVDNTNVEVPVAFHEQFGGTLVHRNPGSNCKQAWRWSACGREAVAFLEQIAELLIVKKPIARLALGAYKMKQGEGLDRERSEQIVSIARKLNKQGLHDLPHTELP